MAPLLEVRDVTVRFGGLSALDSVQLDLRSGEVTGLIGPNGAGKTTLFNVISGLQVPTAGRVLVDGDDVSKLKPFKRARRGVARTFQRLEVFGSLSVRENVLVAAELGERRDEASAAVDELLDRIGLTGVAEERAESLPTGPPAWSSWDGRWPWAPACCSSTSRRPASTRASPRPSATSCSSWPPTASASSSSSTTSSW
jgi:branched-chain amino acid transport system ATP-binding protein